MEVLGKLLTTNFETSTNPIRSSDHLFYAVNGTSQFFNKKVPNA